LEVDKSLPRPAFIHDVARLARKYPETKVLVVLDSSSAAARGCLDRWLEVFSPCQITVAVAVAGVDVDTARAENDLRVLRIADSKLSRLRDTLVSMGLEADIVVSCEPYDPYGSYVKKELETGLVPAISQFRAAYLVHDAIHGTIRCYTVGLLADRLIRRPRRLAVYRAVVRLIAFVAEIFPTNRTRGWRPVKQARHS